MYAIVEIGGKQYRIEKDNVIHVDKVVEENETLNVDKVLLVVDGDKVQIGKPYLTDVKVKTTVMGAVQGKKVSGIKFKRRKNYQRTKGHRRIFLKLKIDDLAIA